MNQDGSAFVHFQDLVGRIDSYAIWIKAMILFNDLQSLQSCHLALLRTEGEVDKQHHALDG